MKEIRGADEVGRVGWWLVAAFIVANVAAATAAMSPSPSTSPSASLSAPAVALLACAAAVPARTWVAAGRRRLADGVARLVAAFALLASWAACVGAAAIGWAGTSGATALFFGWVAVLATGWVRLRRLPVVTAASLLIAAGLAAAGVLAPGAGAAGATAAVSGVTLSLVPLQVLLTGVTSPAFAPAVLVGGLVVLASSLSRLAASLPHLHGATAMHCLAATFAGLTGLALIGTVAGSTAEFTFTEGPAAAGAVPLVICLGSSLALLAVGSLTARSTPVSRRGPALSALALTAVVVGGWVTFTAEGLALVTALLMVLLAMCLGLGTGLFAAAGLVRDGGRLRTRLARAPRRSRPAIQPGRTASPAPAPALLGSAGNAVNPAGMGSAAHARS